MPAVRRAGFSTRLRITRRRYGRLAAAACTSRSIRFRSNGEKGDTMESKPKERVIVEHPVEIEAEATETSKPKRRKAGWKSLLAVAIAIVIVWQLYHAFVQGGKSTNAASRAQQPR